ncbi:D-alanyl-D-alanine carboxypeptidase / D-alanyl-D-alanine-endopeptidase (penicillin-binding protein 4) [Lishizhenia tianjinensis]|uniref:D-alanyl-D-alanine carboxypeptidase / D-alanyl-D-alanine-endopeptidase (Penicillin-binding protein 4) n=1 Tax=Lishizhenia tianjinensis TaxID=477690 RepID=A0A1I7BM77_9FLAO|nr:D-alanyl-D-alanine carboxypeptidase/D-alanyl-D-alanine-endopeptidase [Lishizhenia tianjinensis]SFT88272.1 D-alanyl-D-alanine carboxypeptidase / D-alanyl-D-alanine-endopeptidase (penicillin-binding protein 4) [Lishizhenia tianjinensis]
MKKIIALVCLLSQIQFGFGQITSLEQSLNSLLEKPDMQNATLGFVVKDLSNDEIVIAHNEKATLATASTAKLFTTATNLLVFPSDYALRTKVYYTGFVQDSVLKGDLVIQGCGDPSLGSKYFYEGEEKYAFIKHWTKAVRTKGIKRITGKVIADGSAYAYEGIPKDWTWNDMGNYYGAGPAGCTVFDNLMELHFKTGGVGTLTKITRVEPELPNVAFENFVVAAQSNADNAYVYGAPHQNNRYVTGEIPYNRSDFVVKASVPDPEYLMAYSFKQALEQEGVEIEGEVEAVHKQRQDLEEIYKVEDRVVGAFKGKSLLEIAVLTNHKSINLYAEQLLTWLGKDAQGNTSIKSGLKFINEYWKDKLSSGFEMTDGSGLSRTNRISAQHFVEMLTYMHQSKVMGEFETTLPIAGVSGTLKYVCNGEAGHGKIKAKSGSLNGVKSYAGYVYGKSGKKYAFAIVAQNFNTSSRTMVVRFESLFNAIANM